MSPRVGPLPEATVLRLDSSVRRFAGGTVLVGGSPLRLLRLGARAASSLERLAAGGEVGDRPRDQQLARRLLDAGVAHPELPSGEFAPRNVTLVAPVKDNVAGARRLLAATAELADHVVVDDGSAVPLSTEHLPEAAVRNEKPAGPAAAREAGWRRARTELVAFVDADVVPEHGWLQALLPLFSDPSVTAVAPRVHSGLEDSAVARYESDRSSLDLGTRPASVRPMSRVSYVPSAALVVRRDALDEVGGFDARLRFGEDVDLVWRLIDSGKTVRYQPESRVRHDPRTRLRTWARQRFDYGTSAAPLSARHPNRLSCARISRYSALAWALLAAGRPRLALLCSAATTALFPRKLRGRGVPTAEALRLAGFGHLGAGRLLTEAVRRTWWPLAVLAAPFSKKARWVVLVALLPCLVESAGKPPSWLALRILDDLAYGAGVWRGCAKERTLRPLLPSWTDDALR